MFRAALVGIAGVLTRSQSSDSDDETNTPKDGAVSEREFRRGVQRLALDCDVLHQRLELEAKMSEMMVKLPNFFIGVTAFVLGLYTVAPPSILFSNNLELFDYFGLSQANLGQVETLADVYDFALRMQTVNEKLMPSSPNYWCESRFFTRGWDASLNVPMVQCDSPRLSSMGATDVPTSWATVNASAGLAGPEPSADCLDDEESLRTLVNDRSATCATSLPGICDEAFANSICPRTCGYCPPFEYIRKHKFVKRLVTVLPVVLHQERWKTKPCYGFARKLDGFRLKTSMGGLPTWDGSRASPVIECIDEGNYLDSTYSTNIDCPPEAQGTDWCAAGKFRFSHKIVYQNKPVYPKIIREENGINRMRRLEWLDAQTGEVDVSALAYNPAEELFTFVVARFTIDGSGGLSAEADVVGYRDLVGGNFPLFVASMSVAIASCLAGIAYPALKIIRDRRCANRVTLFEIFSRCCITFFCMVYLYVRCSATPMSVLYEDLLSTYLEQNTLTMDGEVTLLSRYFAALDHIRAKKDGELILRVVAYFLLYLQLVQLMLYFAFHPRMGIVTATVSKAWSALMHFFCIFALLYCMLGFMAHWMLGSHVAEFRTMGGTIVAQARMLYGEYIVTPSAEELTGLLGAMYWLYAFTFMLLVFFTLLNFFLAIIVDAFSDVKADEEQDKTEHDFLNDCLDCVLSIWIYRINGWPPRHQVNKYLRDRLRTIDKELAERKASKNAVVLSTQASREFEELRAASAKLSAADFGAAFPHFDDNEARLLAFLRYYYLKVPDILIRVKKNSRLSSKAKDAGGWAGASPATSPTDGKASECMPTTTGGDSEEMVSQDSNASLKALVRELTEVLRRATGSDPAALREALAGDGACLEAVDSEPGHVAVPRPRAGRPRGAAAPRPRPQLPLPPPHRGGVRDGELFGLDV